MDKKVTSYQKLKNKNMDLSRKIDRLLSDPEYLVEEILSNKIRLGLQKALLYGEPFLMHKPNGEVKLNGLLDELMK